MRTCQSTSYAVEDEVLAAFEEVVRDVIKRRRRDEVVELLGGRCGGLATWRGRHYVFGDDCESSLLVL